jgi:hypothetical protein
VDGRAELLRHAAKRLDVNPDRVVPSSNKFKAQQFAAQQAQMAQMAQLQQPKASASGQELLDGAPVVDNFTPQPQP